MSKKVKLIESMKNNPKNVDLKQIKKLLEDNGYIGINKGGSHWVFRKDECKAITIPYKKPIKLIYIKKALNIIGAYND